MGAGPEGAPDSNGAVGAISEEVGGRTQVQLDPVVDAIGQALQTFYRALVEEPLPSRLLVLLAELEAKEGGAE
jgi:hypothetical protein